MLVRPFRGLRPAAALASRIPSVPYDVIDEDEARRLARNDPYTFLHVVRPEVDLPPGLDPHDARVYHKAGENFRAMVARGWLVRDEQPAFYLYRLATADHLQTGVIGAAAVADYVAGRIRRHEHTRPAKEEDRARLADALSAHPGLVFMAYRDDAAIDAVVERLTSREPRMRFRSTDGVEHAVWVVEGPPDAAELAALLGRIPATYIADGHHRAAAAARICEERRRRLHAPDGDEPWRFFPAAHFPAGQLRLLEYNRVVRDLRGMAPERFLERVRAAGFDVVDDHGPRRPTGAGAFGLYLAGRWRLLRARAAIVPADDPVGSMDVSILGDRLLGPVLEIGDPRTDARIGFVGGAAGVEGLEERVDSGRWAVAFALYPTSMDTVMDVADAGRFLPPKSTWFEPKLRSGLVVQLLDGDRP
jgi:uncharacterized protein (DUF1015 family)